MADAPRSSSHGTPRHGGRREVSYEGRVQGVGFRYTTHRIANDFEVRGYVQNLPDGRVKLVVEGEVGEIEAFLRRIDDELRHHIHCCEQAQVTPTKEFVSFDIRF